MKKKAVTLVEIMIAVVVIGVIAGLGIPFYKSIQEDAEANVCAMNTMVMKAGAEAYAMERDEIPGDLGMIPEQYFDKAYADLLRQKDGWKIRLANFIVGLGRGSSAYAANLKLSKYRCPKGDPAVKYHYAINTDIIGGVANPQANTKYPNKFRNVTDGTILIKEADSTNGWFQGTNTDVLFRHKEGFLGSVTYGIYINKGKDEEPYDHDNNGNHYGHHERHGGGGHGRGHGGGH